MIFCPALVLPCFDQPDLKGKMSIEVITHEEWNAVSNSHVAHDTIASCADLAATTGQQDEWLSDWFISEGFEKIRIYAFDETPKLSSYLWTLNVGNFTVSVYEDYKFPITLLSRHG